MTGCRAGHVLAVAEDRAQVRVDVETCTRCARGQGCGVGLLARRRDAVLDVMIPAEHHLEPGDRVLLIVDPRSARRRGALLYGLPLCGLLAGIALGQPLGDPAAALGGALGLALTVVGLQRLRLELPVRIREEVA